MPVAKVKGEFAVYYEEHGAGPRSLVVLGVADPLGAELASLLADARVLRYDPRGTGRTPSRQPESTAQHATDLASVLKALKIVKPTVLATGTNARIAVAFASRHLRDIKRLILVAPDLTPADETKLGKVGEKAMVLLEPDAAKVAEWVL